MRRSHLFPRVPGDSSQRGEGNGAEGGRGLRPNAIGVYNLTDGTIGQLVEESKRPEPWAYDGEARCWDRESHESSLCL